MTARRERFEVAEDEAGLRLDQWLAKRVPGLSRRKARVLVDLGGVYIDRARVKVASRPVKPGQVIEAVIGASLERDPEETPSYEIVFEDEQLIVVDKPAGLVTAPTPESDRGNLLDLLQRARGGNVWLVHRIDRMTSGLIVFAKTPETNKALGELFAKHDIEREYRAVVAGSPEDQTIDRPIQTKRAVTHVRVLERLPGATLVAATLETGRTHQIRIHLAGIGHPLLGDPEHGGEVSRRYRPRPPRLALHAAVLGIRGQRWEREIPPDLAGWLDVVRRSGSSTS